MALPILAAAGAASTLSSLLDAFKPHKKHHNKQETGSTGETASTGQNMPGGAAGPAGFDPTQLLAKMDSDTSGGVSKTEFGDFLKSLDKSKGGLLEIQAQAAGTTTDNVASTLFGKLDKNADGSLSADELSAIGPGERHRRPNPASGAQDGSQLSLTDQLMKSFDGNGDGSISKDEIAAALDASRNGQERGRSAVKSTQPNLEALAMRAVQAYNRTLGATGTATSA
ncbi:hypothetical protein GCM10007036_33860 [Alsobacter metallidurans]|uniref:EF-hand domain-containing protein n=1 Tax=Alsobacter metallidurans TaxID=340221 RepID=A0A917IAF9_9HYPH|nr:EF-hand domain-containing protein [Alsobacter metallidurans]GGH26226.1 hypothetical protein GCM10007036_33860 [Alsobacter metallidurans]